MADGLADINAAIAELQDQAAASATGEDVEDINSTLEGLETDLDDLLASNNIFTGDLVINSEATLEFAENLRNRIDIVNGSVFIEQSAALDAERLQMVASKFKSITGDLVIRAQSSTVSEVVLDSLAGVSNLKIAQPGSIAFPMLNSVQEVVIGDNYKIDGAIDFSALTDVSKFNSGTLGDGTNDYEDFTVGNLKANTLAAPKAAAIHLNALTYYTPRTLTIHGDDDTELHLEALESKDANGKERNFTLKVNGAMGLTVPGLVLGSVHVEDVESVTLANFSGKITVGEGVEEVMIGALKNDFDATAAEDLVSATLTMDADDKKADFTGLSDLESVSIDGEVGTVTLSDNSSLTELMLGAAIESLTIHNTDLTEVMLDYTNANTKEKGALTLTDNEELLSFTADQVDGLAHLKVTGNSELTTVSFDALENLPTKESIAPKVTIGGSEAMANNFNVETIDQDEADASEGGSFTTNSGLEDLKTYLTAAKDRSGVALKVYFDRADEYRIDGEVQTAPSGGYTIGGSHDAQPTIIDYAGHSGAVKSKRSWVLYETSDSDTAPQISLAANTIKGTASASAPGIQNLYNALNSFNFRNLFSTVGKLTISQGALPEAHIVLDSARTGTVSASTSSSTTNADFVEVKIGKYSTKVYLTTTDDDDFENKTEEKTALRELTGESGTLSAEEVLNEIVSGFDSIEKFPFTVTVNSSATSATLEISAKDKSTKYHNVTDDSKKGYSKIVFSNSNELSGLEKATIQDTREIKRTALYGYAIQVTLEAATAGPSIDSGGASEIGNPPSATGGTSPNDGDGLGEAQLEVTSGSITVEELGAPEEGDALLTDSPDAVAYGSDAAEGSDIDRISWL